MADKEYKYGVKELAKELGIQDMSARVALRNKNIPKNGRSYGWNSQDELRKVADKLRSTAKETKKTKAAAPKKAAPAKKKTPTKKTNVENAAA